MCADCCYIHYHFQLFSSCLLYAYEYIDIVSYNRCKLIMFIDIAAYLYIICIILMVFMSILVFTTNRFHFCCLKETLSFFSKAHALINSDVCEDYYSLHVNYRAYLTWHNIFDSLRASTCCVQFLDKYFLTD